jgi:hypothetical protein
MTNNPFNTDLFCLDYYNLYYLVPCRTRSVRIRKGMGYYNNLNYLDYYNLYYRGYYNNLHYLDYYNLYYLGPCRTCSAAPAARRYSTAGNTALW